MPDARAGDPLRAVRECEGRCAQRLLGGAVALVGVGLLGVGAWARRDVRRGLSQERISIALDADSPSHPVRSASDARRLAELIRGQTVEATGGRTYAETDQFVAANGSTTSDRALALTDERTGHPISNPDYSLWISSTTLQTALMQAYLAFRIADLTSGLGATLVVVGAGLASRR
jgi:hypothetical protein